MRYSSRSLTRNSTYYSVTVLRSQLSICVFYQSKALAEAIEQCLKGDRYAVTSFDSEANFLAFLDEKNHQIDCLIVQDITNWSQLVLQLRQRSALVPIVAIQTVSESGPVPDEGILAGSGVQETNVSNLYYKAIIEVTADQEDPTEEQIAQIPHAIDQAITEFLKLSATDEEVESKSVPSSSVENPSQSLLKVQQQRLAEKLKERLGYLGVYYKRNPKNFFRHLPPPQKQELLDTLKDDYREIVLIYFSDETPLLNQKIDDFVNTAFFADVSVAQIVEIHMELMDEFSKQLKLEGRSEEILLDYRLTLIDTIAHLCEMYRRSIPRES